MLCCAHIQPVIMYYDSRVKNKKLYSGTKNKKLLHSTIEGKIIFSGALTVVTGKIDRSGTQVKETLNKGTEELFKISMVYM